MAYTGTLVSADWSVGEIISCWLAEQQVLNHLAGGFRQHEIDESKLTALDFLPTTLCKRSWALKPKLLEKKLVMAAKRLKTSREEFLVSTEFDCKNSSNELFNLFILIIVLMMFFQFLSARCPPRSGGCRSCRAI